MKKRHNKMASRALAILFMLALIVMAVQPAVARDNPSSPTDLLLLKLLPSPLQYDLVGDVSNAGGSFSKVQIENFRCNSSGDPSAAVDMSCNTTEFGQDFAPDNEIAIAVDPNDPDHLVAGSNDYYYRFNNATGARQAIVPTGFFTSFDGGQTWIDGQIPMRTGNGAGDPAPVFDAKNGVVLMAQLENVAGLSGFWVTLGNVSVSRSTDGGVSWSEPVTVLMGTGAGIGPANRAVFWDKEYITVDNNPSSPFYGRAYLTATRFLNGIQGSYAESPIYLSTSDDGGLTWSTPKEISGSHPSCTFQSTGSGTDCDEDQNSIPEVASNGDVYVYFANFQNEAAWEVPFDFDSQIMVVKSTDGGVTWANPVQVAQREDGTADMPWSVISRQTVWGHQIRWSSDGNITANPANPSELAIVWSERGTPNPNATSACLDQVPGTAPAYDPCNAGPGAVINIYYSTSADGGATWSPKAQFSASPNNQWFPWADYKSDGTLVAAWDEDTTPAGGTTPTNDTFVHTLWDGASKQALGSAENIDVSVTHWSGQYVPQSLWPTVCGGTTPGKDCNVFHGDYTGLAVGPDDSINVVWTGLNALVTSPQIDFYTGQPHQGYRQDAMFARR
jgi:hypothetical protein